MIPTQRDAPRGAGFTFVELLIAATMMSILFVGLGTHLRGGVLVWRRTTDTAESLQQQRMAWGQLERDLANAILYEGQGDLEDLAQFGEAELRWFTVRPSTSQQFGEIAFVTYGCASVDDAQGLWRTSQSISELLAGTEVTPEQLVPSCEALSFQYAYLPVEDGVGLEWSGRWEYPEALPRLVAASAEFKPGQERREVFWIPSGVLQPRTAE